MSQIVSVVIPVYQDGERARQAAETVLLQELPEDISLEIVLVDDGSTDDTAARLESIRSDRVHLVCLPENRGRSEARNVGAAQATGDFLVFMDCDCLPVGTRFLDAHITSLRSGAVASTGPVVGVGSGFWHRYQSDASARRKRHHALGSEWSGSSQNLAVLRSAFRETGGFDREYLHYGFEDRDLLARLGRLGRVAWTERACVSHTDDIDLTTVCRKMIEAARYSAPRFAEQHPAAYKTLGYAAIDGRKRRWLRPIGRAVGSRLPAMTPHVEALIRAGRLPYPILKATVKLIVAMSFLYGSTLSDEHGRMRQHDTVT
jgi:GT2 family glycosyltransferase